MRRAAFCLVLAGLLLAPAGARADELTGRLLVTLEPGASTRAQSSALATAGARRSGARVPQLDLVTVRPTVGNTLAQTAKALRRRSGVERVEVERRHQLRLQPNDPALGGPEQAAGTPPNTPVQWWAQRTNLFSAWDLTRGSDARVAIIDTGADPGHPELAGKIVGTFRDGNPTQGTFDRNGHGTHVASLACGAGNNATAIVGAGLDCKLLILQTDLSDGSVAASIVQAVNSGAQAINMSFGTDGSRPAPQALADAVDFAVSRNVVLVGAAADAPVEEQGDPANLLQPTGTAPDLGSDRIKGLSVTASNFSDARASFAGRGSQISMAAPGFFLDNAGPPGILAAFPGNSTELEEGSGGLIGGSGPCGCRAAFANDNRYAYLAGTSMSAPMIAATAALMRDLNPDLGALEIVRILTERASRPAGQGWNPETGWGILNAGQAVAVAAVTDRRAPATEVRGSRRVRRARSYTLKLSGADGAGGRARPTGIARYELWRSANGGRFRRFTTTTRTRKKVRVKAGSRYRWYSIAVDKAGNREQAPGSPDLSTRVDRRRR